jgi:hypothetical protein
MMEYGSFCGRGNGPGIIISSLFSERIIKSQKLTGTDEENSQIIFRELASPFSGKRISYILFVGNDGECK